MQIIESYEKSRGVQQQLEMSDDLEREIQRTSGNISSGLTARAPSPTPTHADNCLAMAELDEEELKRRVQQLEEEAKEQCRLLECTLADQRTQHFQVLADERATQFQAIADQVTQRMQALDDQRARNYEALANQAAQYHQALTHEVELHNEVLDLLGEQHEETRSLIESMREDVARQLQRLTDEQANQGQRLPIGSSSLTSRMLQRYGYGDSSSSSAPLDAHGVRALICIVHVWKSFVSSRTLAASRRSTGSEARTAHLLDEMIQSA